MIVVYMRVSTNKETQKHDRQKNAIEEYARQNNFSIDKFYSDTISGKTKADTRPNYQEMKKSLRTDDVLIVSDLDRIGRDASNVIIELKELQSNGIKVIALDIPYMNDFNNVNNNSMYNMIVDILITLKAHIAQQELEKTRSRILQGLQATDKKLGRPKADLPPDFIKQYKKFKNGVYGKMSSTNFAKMLNIGRSTLYKYIDIYENERAAQNI